VFRPQSFSPVPLLVLVSHFSSGSLLLIKDIRPHLAFPVPPSGVGPRFPPSDKFSMSLPRPSDHRASVDLLAVAPSVSAVFVDSPFPPSSRAHVSCPFPGVGCRLRFFLSLIDPILASLCAADRCLRSVPFLFVVSYRVNRCLFFFLLWVWPCCTFSSLM